MSELPVVLVTGGAGYIGSHAVLALKDAGIPVVVYDNLTTGVRSAVPDDVTLIEGDIGDVDAVRRAIRDSGAAAVMHFAAWLSVPDSVRAAKSYVAAALHAGRRWDLGKGPGPMDHFATRGRPDR